MQAPDFTQSVWRKSSRSNGMGAECVEVAHAVQAVGVRDSKNPGGAVLAFAANDMALFLGAAKRGRFDR